MIPKPAEGSARSPGKSRWRRLLRWSLRVLIVLIVLGIALYAVASYWTARTIRNEIARIRAAGDPLTFADLNALSPKADPGNDAGPLYQAAAILAAAAPPLSDTSYNAIFDPGNIPPAKALADAQRLVDQSTTALELLDRAATLPACSADVGIENGEALALRNAGRFKALNNMASVRTRLLLFQGKSDAATHTLVSALPLMRVFEREPILIDALLQNALLNRNCIDAASLLERGHLSDASLAAISAGLANAHPIDPHRMFLAERVYFIEMSRSVILPNDVPGPAALDALPLPESWGRRTSGLAVRMLAADNLLLEGRFIAATTADWPHALDALNQIADHPGSSFTFSGITTRILAPSVAKAQLGSAQILSVWQSTRAAIDVERYRLAHSGALPDSLNELPSAAALPPDPLTGKPLLYAKTPDGYCIYSAGYRPPADRDQNPIDWSKKWGIHIRTTPPQ